jgi:hypothetical protein
MKLQLLFSLIIMAGIISCKPGSTTTETASSKCIVPSGRYINSTVLKDCPGKMPYDIPSYSYEMTFNGKDSVTIDNGFENYTLPFTATANPCEFVIPKATAEGDLLFRVISDSTFELVDTAWTKVPSASFYSKVNTGTQQSWGFKEFLNQCIIAGDYAFFIDGKLQPNQASLFINGQVNGMKPFIGYALCYAGDCVGETEPPSRIIELIDNQGKVQTFSFKNIEGKMAIELYEIGEGNPEIKGERPIGKLKYELRTE